MIAVDSDIDAMLRLKDGDDLALNEIMDRWQRRVTAFLLRMVNEDAVAVDLAQETFVRVYQCSDRYRPSGTFSTWLFAIAANLARQHLRWQRRHPTESMDVDADTPLSDRIASPEESPDLLALREERAALVKRAVSELPHELREAIVLFEYENMSYVEIAAVVGGSPKAIETRLYRARNLLREKLRPWLGPE
ncbi:MAG: hypothetical protein BGO12_01110 [Verrucomicrobia bacterium 61-8]|nr:sigma-70 family RNA polymerase sigma factor [Verrucomicrobiota bacterium]OJV10748.1 MAG: hypothetical protein BGO12_01110 [Verrucomicrobia bacterium 61-8]